MLNILLLTTLNIAQADNENRPLRPTTHPADPALSEGTVENFQRLYCDPEQIASILKPSSPANEQDKQTLLIPNRYNGWVDVSVGDNKIGRLGPLTTGAIHNLPAGTYTVSISVERVQYTDIEEINTKSEQEILTPGNAKASIASDPNYKKPGLEDNRVFQSGNLQPYALPLSKPSQE